jgi:hypothetical protein
MLSKVMIKLKKELNLSDLSQKRIRNKMADVFLKLEEHKKNTALSLAPPSSYNLNLKTLTKVSKVS